MSPPSAPLSLPAADRSPGFSSPFPSRAVLEAAVLEYVRIYPSTLPGYVHPSGSLPPVPFAPR